MYSNLIYTQKPLKLGLAFVFAMLFILSVEIQAAPVGTLLVEKGAVKIRRVNVDSFHQHTNKEIPVFNLDIIQTAWNSRVKIVITEDNNLIRLFSNSIFTILIAEKEETKLSMMSGKARFQIRQPIKEIKRRKKRFSLRTVTALINVKGTEFIIGIVNGDTNLLTLSGAVSFANLIDSAAEVVVNKNYASKIKRNERPTIPVEVPQEVREAVILGELSTVFNEIKFGDVSPPPKPKGEEKSQKGEQSEESLEDNNDQDIESINQELESIRKELEDRSTESKTINFTVIEE